MLSPDFNVLIVCCREKTDISAVQTLFSTFSDDDYLNLHRLSNRHGLYPLLYKTVISADPDSLSPKTKALFKESNMAVVRRSMMMSAELLQLMQLFETNGIEAIAFKGPALGEIAYGSVILRQYGDLDILIKHDAIKKTIALLLERGYRPEIDLQDSTIDTFYNCVNVIGLYKGPVRVEIHWELLSKNYAIDWDEETLWHDTETVMINHKPIKILSFENHILYLCAHGSKHLFERLEWICDIDRAVRAEKDVDWDHLMSVAKALGIERMLLFGLTLSELLFQLPLPKEVLHKIDNDPAIDDLIQKVIDLHYSSKGANTKSYSTFRLLWQMRENFNDRLRFAYRGLFAPKFDDFKFVALPKKALFLYPIIRPFRLLVKYFNR